jgi:DeoR/GlpR family transcriptional regulator of sugar metabolism
VSNLEQTLIPAQRRRLIREYLEIHQIARSSTLSDLLKASEATIRRDLEFLEMQGIVERTHGGAILSQRLPKEPAYALSAQAHPEEKRAIGRAAGMLVEDGDTVFLNSGTTTTEVLRNLRLRSDLPNITLITSNVTAALEARDAPFEVILLGGILRPRSNSVAGRFAIDMLKQVYAKKCFVGVDGISLKYNITTPSSAEAEIAAVMIERTRGLAVIVADCSKWGVVSNFEMAKIDQIQVLVTDENLSDDARTQLEGRAIEVVIASRDVEPEGLLKLRSDQEKPNAVVLQDS